MCPYDGAVQLSLWRTLVGACLLISFTPGAGAISTMANSLAAGWARSIWGVLGQQVALVIHIVIVALGVGVLVATNHWLFTAIRWAGAAYLVFWACGNGWIVQWAARSSRPRWQRTPRCPATCGRGPCFAAACW